MKALILAFFSIGLISCSTNTLPSSSQRGAFWIPCDDGVYEQAPEEFRVFFANINRPFLCAYEKGDRMRLFGKKIRKLRNGRGYVLIDPATTSPVGELVSTLEYLKVQYADYLKKRDISARIKVVSMRLLKEKEPNVYLLKLRYKGFLSGYLAAVTHIRFQTSGAWYDLILYTQRASLSEAAIKRDLKGMLEHIPIDEVKVF